MQAYCIKCKEKREIKDPVPSTFKNGTPIMSGICPICGSKLLSIQKKVKVEVEKPLEEAVAPIEETVEPLE